MTYRVPVYIGGPDVVVYTCSVAYQRWQAQRGCEGSVKDPARDRCWYVTSDGVCKRIEMENEEYQRGLTGRD